MSTWRPATGRRRRWCREARYGQTRATQRSARTTTTTKAVEPVCYAGSGATARHTPVAAVVALKSAAAGVACCGAYGVCPNRPLFSYGLVPTDTTTAKVVAVSAMQVSYNRS